MRRSLASAQGVTMWARSVGFSVPGKPQGKGRPRFAVRGGHARAYTPEKTRDYEARAAVAARLAMSGEVPIGGAVEVELFVWLPVPSRFNKAQRAAALAGDIRPTCKPDADNVAKAVLDGVQGVAFEDDAQVSDLIVRRRFSAVPGVDVKIYAVGNDAI